MHPGCTQGRMNDHFFVGVFWFVRPWLKKQSPPRLQNLYYGQQEMQCHPISCPAPSLLLLCNRPAKNNILTMSSAPLVQRSKVVLYHQATQSLVFFVYGWAYWPDHMWTNDELLAVTPKILLWYIKIKVYDSENAQPDVQPPLNYQSNTVLFWKKAWSYFMLDQITPWNEISLVGNPWVRPLGQPQGDTQGKRSVPSWGQVLCV